jgi:hypothetical protein
MRRGFLTSPRLGHLGPPCGAFSLSRRKEAGWSLDEREKHMTPDAARESVRLLLLHHATESRRLRDDPHEEPEPQDRSVRDVDPALNRLCDKDPTAVKQLDALRRSEIFIEPVCDWPHWVRQRFDPILDRFAAEMSDPIVVPERCIDSAFPEMQLAWCDEDDRIRKLEFGDFTDGRVARAADPEPEEDEDRPWVDRPQKIGNTDRLTHLGVTWADHLEVDGHEYIVVQGPTGRPSGPPTTGTDNATRAGELLEEQTGIPLARLRTSLRARQRTEAQRQDVEALELAVAYLRDKGLVRPDALADALGASPGAGTVRTLARRGRARKAA